MDDSQMMGMEDMEGMSHDPAMLVDFVEKILTKYLDTKLMLIAAELKNKKKYDQDDQEYEESAADKFRECMEWKDAKLEEFISMLGGQAMTEEDLMMEEGMEG